jgi:hypothetical protein
VEISDDAVSKCTYESCVKVVNKSNIQSKTPPRVTHTCDNTKDVTSVSISDPLGHITVFNFYCYKFWEELIAYFPLI